MNNLPTDNEAKERPAFPFDDYPEENGDWRKITMMRPGAATVILRVLSTILFVLALLGATMIVVLDLLHAYQPALLNWHLKSGVPLILVGSAFLLLQLTLVRTPVKLFLAISVSAAFILWGSEQFLQNPAVVSFIDDLVVLLFVIDLSIVIRGYLKRESDSSLG